jgi:hypothetical protein
MQRLPGDRKTAFCALDPSYPAYRELKALGEAIARQNDAPRWRNEGDFRARSFPKSTFAPADARAGWVFKWSRKTQVLLLAHAIGRTDYNSIATALAVTHKEALFITANLLRDGLLKRTKSGRSVTIEPNAKHPFHAEVSDFVRKLLQTGDADIAGLARALKHASKPRTLGGRT